jgi:hypothetical protein
VSRTDNYLTILDAAAKIQYNVALILEAKALHAEKSRNWICNHLSMGAYSNNLDQVKQTANIHEQLIQVIDGITKMENSLTKNLEILIGEKSSSDGGFGDMMGLGGPEK